MHMSPAISFQTPAVSNVPMPWNNIESKSCHEQKLRSHEVLFCDGDEAGFIYEVVEGVMCNYRILPDGRRHVISFAYPGELIGLGHSESYRFYCEAVGEARVRSVSKAALMRDAQEHADIGRCLFEFASAELASMQEHQLLLGRKCAIEKLASFLLALAHRNCGDEAQSAQFQLPMTRSDIGDFLGLTIETVSRNITKLKNMGVIDLPQSSTVLVRDIERLEGLAEGEDGAF